MPRYNRARKEKTYVCDAPEPPWHEALIGRWRGRQLALNPGLEPDLPDRAAPPPDGKADRRHLSSRRETGPGPARAGGRKSQPAAFYQDQVFTFGDNPASWAGVYRQAANASRLDGKIIGVEPVRMRVLELRILEEALPAARFPSGESTLASLRMVKDAAELVLMRQAAQIAPDCPGGSPPPVGWHDRAPAGLRADHAADARWQRPRTAIFAHRRQRAKRLQPACRPPPTGRCSPATWSSSIGAPRCRIISQT